MIIAFDLDGTLVDSIPLHIEASIDTGRKMGITITKEKFLDCQSTTTEDIIKHIKKGISDKDAKKFVKLKNAYVAKNFSKITLFPDVISTLSELCKKARIIILSNTPYPSILMMLETVGLNPLFFDMIVGRDLVEHPKPAPDELFLAQKIEHHKVDYFIGDSLVDVKTGKKAGVKTIAVATGFNTKEDLKKARPHALVDSLSEIVEIIK